MEIYHCNQSRSCSDTETLQVESELLLSDRKSVIHMQLGELVL